MTITTSVSSADRSKLALARLRAFEEGSFAAADAGSSALQTLLNELCLERPEEIAARVENKYGELAAPFPYGLVIRDADSLAGSCFPACERPRLNPWPSATTTRLYTEQRSTACRCFRPPPRFRRMAQSRISDGCLQR